MSLLGADASLALDAFYFLVGLHYYRFQNPQAFWFGRISMIYAALRRLSHFSDDLVAKFVRRYSELGLAVWTINWLSRFYPDLLAIPAGVSGKRVEDGTFHPLLRLIWTPYISLERYQYTNVCETLAKMPKPFLDKYNLVWQDDSVKIYLGMWPGYTKDPKEALPEDVDIVFDLCNENAEPKWVVEGRQYLCVPTWDQALPQDKKRFIECVRYVSSVPRGSMYIHCAFGVSRSALTTVCVLLKRGICPTIAEAIKLIKSVRPAVNLRQEHMEFLEDVVPVLMDDSKC